MMWQELLINHWCKRSGKQFSGNTNRSLEQFCQQTCTKLRNVYFVHHNHITRQCTSNRWECIPSRRDILLNIGPCMVQWYIPEAKFLMKPLCSADGMTLRWRIILNFFVVVAGSWLTNWGRVMHISVSKLTIIGSEKGLPPSRCQTIIWTNAGIVLIGPLGTNFGEILIKIRTFPFTKMHLKISGKWRPFCIVFDVLIWFTMMMGPTGRQNTVI